MNPANPCRFCEHIRQDRNSDPCASCALPSAYAKAIHDPICCNPGTISEDIAPGCKWEKKRKRRPATNGWDAETRKKHSEKMSEWWSTRKRPVKKKSDRPKTAVFDKRYDGVLALYESGMSIGEIAEQRGAKYSYIQKALKRQGYAPRKRKKEAAK